MKKLSIFVDESGDFGPYAKHSPFYIITMILHDQSSDISNDIAKFGDLREMNAIYGRNVSSIEGIVSVCKDNNNVFPQDVERIIELMETIRDQHIIVMASVLGKRKAEKK